MTARSNIDSSAPSARHALPPRLLRGRQFLNSSSTGNNVLYLKVMGGKISRKQWLIALAILLPATFVIGFLPGSPAVEDLPDKVDFNYDIRPILAQNCFVCHGPDTSSRKANLRLDTYEGATALLKNGGAAIVPGKAHKSLLLDRVSSTDPGFRMPPPEAKKTLTAREVALLKRWIQQGAKWAPHWALIPPKAPDLPRDLQEAPPSEAIDYLIGQKLKANRLTPSPAAGKNSLIRRVAYLLTGLPPTPEDLQTFLADESATAYEKMVDRYLGSPQYGERWARHWMDLVRYGEYMGHEFDFPISGAWHYRDYLIRAFNQDVPYDLFVKEHLAGDLLPEPRLNPEEGFNESSLGTAYFFLGEGKHSPVNVKQEEADRFDNMIDVTSKTFQALTVGCARCHDHKFDPIPTTDYYAMYGMFESARIGPVPAKMNPKQLVQVKKLKEITGEIRSQLGRQLLAATQKPGPEFISRQKRFIQSLPETPATGNHKVIGDFRGGEWKGWYSDGLAFGEKPLMGAPVFDPKTRQFLGFNGGFASSRYLGAGVMGALRSPNFTIEHDSIAVRARGLNGTIRIIVDNFQVIRFPLYGSLEQVANTPEWKTYILDLALVQGHKAYLEFMPGKYEGHTYKIRPEDYVEVEYAVAFDGKRPDMALPMRNPEPVFSVADQRQAVADWMQDRTRPGQVEILNSLVKKARPVSFPTAFPALLSAYDSIAAKLYDPDHFLGPTEGETVFSPVFIRGSIDQRTEATVPHGFLSAVPTPQHGSGRLAWAESVADPANPLTARVMVNRLWLHLFGRGIVETVDNFGLQGTLPSHPELLDYLALRFVEDGWSVKGMIRHMLLSRTFQRSTESLADNRSADPQNTWLHHFPIRRLEAEAIRDGIMATTGCIDLTMYGEPVPIHLTDFMTGRGRPAESGPLDGFGRRSIYLAVRRNFIPPMMLVFDTPIPFSTFGRRNTTNVPGQSLTLMNDPFVHEQAWYWAENLLQKGDKPISERVDDIFIRAFSRPASPEEQQAAKSLLENLAKEHNSSVEAMQNDPQIWADYCHAVFNLKEFIHLI